MSFNSNQNSCISREDYIPCNQKPEEMEIKTNASSGTKPEVNIGEGEQFDKNVTHDIEPDVPVADDTCTHLVNVNIVDEKATFLASDKDTKDIASCHTSQTSVSVKSSHSKCACIQKPEGKDAWFVLVVTVFLSSLSATELGSFGLYYVEYAEYFDVSKGAVGWIKAFQKVTAAISGVFASAFVKVYGSRRVSVVAGGIYFIGLLATSFSPNIYICYIFHGIAVGMGIAIGTLCIQIIIQQHFIRNKVIGTGVSYLGFTLGSSISPILISYMLEQYGLRGCLLIHSAIIAHSIPLGFLLHPAKQENTTKDSNGKKVNFCQKIKNELCDLSPFKNPLFVSVFIAGLFTFCGIASFVSHLPGRAIFYGSSRAKAGFLHSILSVSALVARIASMFLANMKRVNKVVFKGSAAIMLGLGTLSFAFVTKYELMLLSSLLFGFGMGALSTVFVVALVSLFGLENLPKILGLYSFASNTGAALGPPLTGVMFDMTGNYDYPMMLSGIIAITAGIILFIVAFVDHRNKHKQQTQTITDTAES